MILGKDLFVDKRCVDRPLPRGTLGKGFAESKTAFAERLGLSAKPLYAVVNVCFGKAYLNYVALFVVES